MGKRIEFSPIIANSDLITANVDPPITAKNVIPNWFKNIPRYSDGSKKLRTDDMSHNLTLRHCSPFLDAFCSGYVMTTWTDIHFTRQKDGSTLISYGNNELCRKIDPPLLYQAGVNTYVKGPLGYTDFIFAWKTYWRVRTPKGVSCLFTQPMNRPDLPFITLSGVIETDSWTGSDVLNVCMKDDFEGTISKGTPFVQIVPFIRSDWDSKIQLTPDCSMENTRATALDERQNKKKSGYYRDKIHVVKKYN